MKIRTKLSLDQRIGVPIARVLNVAARPLGWLLRRDHSVSTGNVHTVVFAKYAGLGSILQATPLIRSIKARFPQARIIFVTSRSCQTLVERLEHIDKIVAVDDRGIWRIASSTLRVILLLVREKADLFFDLEVYSAYGSIMSLLSLARNRFGLYRETAEHKLGIYTRLMYFNMRCPIRYIYLQLGRAIGCEPVEPNRLGQIVVNDSDRAELAGKLRALGLDGKQYLVVNPNASDLMVERRWPGDRFAALIDRLDVPVILIGLPSERAYVTGVVDQISGGGKGRAYNLAGELSLGGLLAVLQQARCLITNDTGPMHMAWALGTPAVCLFGPVDPAHYGWAGPRVEILYRRVYCSPCLHEADEPPCGGNNICMQRIEVDEVLAAIQRTMTETVPDRPPIFEPRFFVDGQGAPLGLVVHGATEDAIS